MLTKNYEVVQMDLMGIGCKSLLFVGEGGNWYDFGRGNLRANFSGKSCANFLFKKN